MTDVKQALRGYITSELMYDKSDIILDDSVQLISQGVVDSIGVFMLVKFIEDTFSVNIEPNEVVLENFETLTAITNFVHSKTT